MNGTELYVDVDGPQLRVRRRRTGRRPDCMEAGFDQGYGGSGCTESTPAWCSSICAAGQVGRPPLSTCTLEQMC